ncbi:MAG: T9SS type A sorting domain-containing protein [Bacteroidetes bacterium]|nr:T9SS type A sorting domain-containing protein [Bacteroidota bacterium]
MLDFNPMKRNILILISLFLVMINFKGLFAQEAILAASADAGGSSGSVTYSVGQTAFLFHSASNGNIMEGVQQPYEIQFYAGMEEETGITLHCKVFPNPSSGKLSLAIENSDLTGFRFELMDASGKLLHLSETDRQETEISLDCYASSVYFLSVFHDNTPLKTFRIIKR